MASIIIKQPNGLYCIYSTVINNLTYLNLNKDEVVQAFIDKKTALIILDVIEKLEIVDTMDDSFYNTMLDKIKLYQGIKESNKLAKLTNKPQK